MFAALDASTSITDQSEYLSAETGSPVLKPYGQSVVIHHVLQTSTMSFLPFPHTIPRYLLATVFLLAAQARFTPLLTPAFHEYETSKSLRTQQNSWLGVSPWLHQRIIGIPVGMVGMSLIVPDSLWSESWRLRGWSASGAVILLGLGITARVNAGMGVALPVTVLALSIWVACTEFGLLW